MPSACDLAERLKASPARIEGRGTRAGARPVEAEPVSTLGLDAIVAYEPEDFTAVLQAGVPVSKAQATFAESGQMLAIDPPGDGTIGGLFATADSGPLRHRYGAPRDLIIGVELALADGTVAHGGGRVIKNVAGYDLPKLAAGSFGTLGMITEVAVRLHPLPTQFATAVFRGGADELQAFAVRCASRPLEAEALDVRWDGNEGEVLVRFSGSSATDRAAAVADEIVEDDEGMWEEQRVAPAWRGDRARPSPAHAAGAGPAGSAGGGRPRQHRRHLRPHRHAGAPKRRHSPDYLRRRRSRSTPSPSVTGPSSR